VKYIWTAGALFVFIKRLAEIKVKPETDVYKKVKFLV